MGLLKLIRDAIQYSIDSYHYSSINHYNAQALIIEEEDGYVIAVRGTEIKKIIDIIYDLHAIPWPTRYGWVHRGFYKMAKGLAKDIKENTNDKPIKYITGHSMGGSVAMLLGWIFHVDVIAIGSPMCFRSFRKLPFKLTIVKNCPDPIPRTNFWFYREYGDVIQLGEESCCISKNKDVNLLQMTRDLKYHGIKVYKEAYANLK
tara:strand:+ start:167 stop:775 length:609 start_codon:yes stop_codon:yes gene_type:complete